MSNYSIRQMSSTVRSSNSGGFGSGLSQRYASSVYGGSGGRGTRVSASSASYGAGGGLGSAFSFGSGGGTGGGSDFQVGANEKATMQNLNDRLATYLDKVRSLEKANADLELKIRNFLDSKAGPSRRDYSKYYTIIADLQGKLLDAFRVGGSLHISIDNAKLATDDFRSKYEAELAMRQSVEADIGELRRVLDQLTLVRSDLELQIEGLRDELVFLKKNHEEAMMATRSQVSGQINVEVDAKPQPDLNLIIAEMREQYESVANKNKRELQEWFDKKTEGLKAEMKEKEEIITTSKTEVTDLSRSLQSLEIELQSQLSLKAAIEQSLREKETEYSNKLHNLQERVLMLEGELQMVRSDTEGQRQEYQILLDIKTRLEMEIAEYRRLLDGEATTTSTSSSTSSSSSKTTKYIVVTEEVKDGKVVTTSSSEVSS
ncbi:Keratin, type I cytoskeletal 13 [Oryzias melastigma]|uniref:Keratin, type I cytoskeletal 13 n=1 Tax=Oryzias melastigma TaxID=30732 RepID=A0A834C055_ORYME|nr:Keratin, type I cytoskeletal 13 [Oryzias melastigma]